MIARYTYTFSDAQLALIFAFGLIWGWYCAATITNKVLSFFVNLAGYVGAAIVIVKFFR